MRKLNLPLYEETARGWKVSKVNQASHVTDTSPWPLWHIHAWGNNCRTYSGRNWGKPRWDTRTARGSNPGGQKPLEPWWAEATHRLLPPALGTVLSGELELRLSLTKQVLMQVCFGENKKKMHVCRISWRTSWIEVLVACRHWCKVKWSLGICIVA